MWDVGILGTDKMLHGQLSFQNVVGLNVLSRSFSVWSRQLISGKARSISLFVIGSYRYDGRSLSRILRSNFKVKRGSLGKRKSVSLNAGAQTNPLNAGTDGNPTISPLSTHPPQSQIKDKVLSFIERSSTQPQL